MAPKASEQSTEDTLRFKAHWTIFLPAIIVGLLYGGLWIFLLAVDRGDTALARVLLLVVTIVVPVLLVRAYLRFASFSLLIGRQALSFRRGWIRPGWRRLQLNALTGVRAASGPLGSLLGGGTLIISRFDGGKIQLQDMEFPKEAARQISLRLRILRARNRPG